MKLYLKQLDKRWMPGAEGFARRDIYAEAIERPTATTVRGAGAAAQTIRAIFSTFVADVMRLLRSTRPARAASALQDGRMRELARTAFRGSRQTTPQDGRALGARHE